MGLTDSEFNELSGQCYAKLVRITCSKGIVLQSAEDLVQDGLMSAYKKNHLYENNYYEGGDVEDAEGFSRWVLAFIKYHVLEYRANERTKWRGISFSEIAKDIPEKGFPEDGPDGEELYLVSKYAHHVLENPEQYILRKELEHVVEKTLQSTDHVTVSVFYLCLIDSFSVGEVARKLGLSIRDTHEKLARARQKLSEAVCAYLPNMESDQTYHNRSSYRLCTACHRSKKITSGFFVGDQSAICKECQNIDGRKLKRVKKICRNCHKAKGSNAFYTLSNICRSCAKINERNVAGKNP